MNPHDFLRAASACAGEMMRNAAYIQQELPAIDMPEDVRSLIQNLCDEWIGTKFDVTSEIGEIYELEQQGQPAERIQPKLAMVHRWLAESADEAHSCILKLRAEVAQGQLNPVIMMLVTESATNVLLSVPGPP